MISRLIALSLIISVAFSALTWTNPTSFDPANTVVTPGSNGYTVTLNSAGWAYGDAISLTPNVGQTSWATLLRNSGTGQTAVGLVGATCGSPITNSAAPGNTGSLTGQAANSCPADFATVYTGTRPAGTTSSGTLTGDALVVGSPVGFLLTQPSGGTASQTIGIGVTDQAVTPVTTQGVTGVGDATNNDNSAGQHAIATLSYTLYVQTTGAASVCFQNQAQFNTAPGDCGQTLSVVGHTPDSGHILSTTACIFVALIAFILYN